jgi:AmmeMemoRadiSam system protein B
MFSGSFYPENQPELAGLLSQYFQETKLMVDSPVKAVIVPHAGYIYSGLTAAWGFDQLRSQKTEAGRQKEENFVVIGPSHNFGFLKIFGNGFNFWETPLGRVKQYPPVGGKQTNDEYFIPEHSVEVQLPFLQYLFNDFSVSCFLTGDKIDLSRESRYFQENYQNSVFIISSDLSHHLSQSQANSKDAETISAIINGNADYFDRSENTACGENGIRLVMQLAKINKWKSKLVNYDTSAGKSGDAARVVGYASIVYY